MGKFSKLKTFTEPKELVENPHYQVQRQKSLCELADDMIDAPIIELMTAIFDRDRTVFAKDL